MNSQLQRNCAEVAKFCRQMDLTLTPLEEDMVFAARQWQADATNQFWRRTVIRCLFASTEALLWNMKHIAPKVAKISGVTLTDKELEILNEERVKTAADGKSQRLPKYLSFPDNVKATFALFGKVHQVPVTLKYDAGFNALCAAYQVRCRLMHPKRPCDPDVSDPEIATAKRGVAWFFPSHHSLAKECLDALIALSA